MRIPEHGLSKEEVFSALETFAARDYDWKTGKCYAYTFDAGREVEAVAREAFTKFMSKSALDPTFFPSVLELENRIVAMAAAHLGGDSATSGVFTSGGTESIILAVKAARDYFRSARPGIREPEMILPVTAHAAFHKAAHYLGVKAVITRVDPLSFRADPLDMKRAITPNTILLVGSAASYAHGVVDPIPEIARLAREYDLLMHVDGCIGGFLLPYFREFGAEFPDFDFSVPGVTSISMDLHKYCYAPKGASVVLYQNPELRRHQIYACASWTGYTIVNTTVQSTKGAGPMAGAWAVLSFIGQNGYRDLARRLYDTTQQLVAGIESIPQFRVLGNPDLPLIAFTSDSINVFHVIDAMNDKGWHIQAQLRTGKLPENIHLSVNPGNLPHSDAFLEDLKEVACQVRAKPRSRLARTVSALFGGLDPDHINDAIFKKIIGMAGIERVGVPTGMAEINDIMNALPPSLSERLLIEYINRLFRQPEELAPLPSARFRPYLPKGTHRFGDTSRGSLLSLGNLTGRARDAIGKVAGRLTSFDLPLLGRKNNRT